MAQFGPDNRRELLNMPLDVNSVLTGAGAEYSPELCLERGAIAISMRENDGRLPPIPRSENEIKQCDQTIVEYANSFFKEHRGSAPNEFRILLSGFCYPWGVGESQPTLQFLFQTVCASTNDWYGSASGLGLFRYSRGPVATHVRYPAATTSGFWDTPLFSLGAYQEDIDRIRRFKEDLSLGKGERSFVFSGVMNALENHLEVDELKPAQIRRVVVERDGPATASIRVMIATQGEFVVDTQICPATWRVLLRRPRKD